VALRRFLDHLTASTSELEARRLKEFCASHSECRPMAEAEPRQEVSLVGEITSLRIVPHEGSPWLEATITDSTGSVLAVWTGRRRIPGVAPGKRLIIGGRGSPTGPGGRLLYFNPRYELL
jgi:hypothetical protein